MYNFQIAVLGPQVDLRYDYEHLGNSPSVLKEMAEGTHPFSQKLCQASKPMIIVGADLLQRSDGAAILGTIQKLTKDLQEQVGENWKVLNILHKVASQVSNCGSILKRITINKLHLEEYQ